MDQMPSTPTSRPSRESDHCLFVFCRPSSTTPACTWPAALRAEGDFMRLLHVVARNLLIGFVSFSDLPCTLVHPELGGSAGNIAWIPNSDYNSPSISLRDIFTRIAPSVLESQLTVPTTEYHRMVHLPLVRPLRYGGLLELHSQPSPHRTKSTVPFTVA